MLCEIQERIRSEVNNDNDSIIVIDSQSRIVLWNDASESLFGYSADEVLGSDFNIVIPEEYHNLNKYRIRLMLQTGVARFPEKPIELAVRGKGDSEVIGEFHPAMLSTKEGMFFYVVVHDVTVKKCAKKNTSVLKAQPIRVGKGLRKKFENIVRTAGEVLQADFAVYQKVSESLLYCDASWKAPHDFDEMQNKEGTVCYDIIKQNKQRPTIIHDLDKTVFVKTDPTISLNSLKTVIGIPVRIHKKPIGSFCVFFKHHKKMDVNELRLFRALTRALADKEEFVRTEEKLKQNKRKLEIAETNIRRLSKQILLYREEERKNISATLHDEVGSMVVALSSGLTIAEEEIKDGHLDDALIQIIQVKKKLDSAVDNLKKMAVDLRPPSLDIIGLKGVLEEFFSDIEEQTKIEIQFTCVLNDIVLNDTIATTLYRFVQESINNSIKHASAHTITVVLSTSGNTVKLAIRDDGRGFNSAKFSQGTISSKIGLWGMKMRAQALEGTFSIKSQAGQGTRISIAIPLREE
ncbi:PAS domain S-box protein [Thermodesulfobacteriota bacterium]